MILKSPSGIAVGLVERAMSGANLVPENPITFDDGPTNDSNTLVEGLSSDDIIPAETYYLLDPAGIQKLSDKNEFSTAGT